MLFYNITWALRFQLFDKQQKDDFFTFIYLFVYVGGTNATVQVWRSEDSPWEITLSFHYVGSET